MDVTTGEPYLEPQGQGSVEIPPNYAAQTETPTDTTSTEQLAETAKQSAKQGVDQVKHTVMTQAASQKDQAAQSLHTVSGAVNQAAQQLRQNNQEPMARAAESAAANISQFADYLRSRDVSDIVDEVENFARRQPALFLSGAFLVGVLGARFLKSSRTGMRQPDTSQQWRGATSTDAGQYTPQPRSYRKPTYPNNRAPLNKRAPTLGE